MNWDNSMSGSFPVQFYTHDLPEAIQEVKSVPKRLDDPVLAALKEYGQLPGDTAKKGVLLTPAGGYFLYGDRFCGMEEFELEFMDADCRIQGREVPSPLFFCIRPGTLRVTGDRPYNPTLVSLIFHIRLEQDEPLRGILLSAGQEMRFALFTDAETEGLYRLSRKTVPSAMPPVPPEDTLEGYAENLRRNDLHWLTNLYLQGRQVRYLPGEYLS